MPACRALPASWQTWSMWSTMCSSVTPASCGVVLPRIQPGTIIQASSAPPITRAAGDQRLDLLVGELPRVGTSARQLLWLAHTGP